jgi:hypothetical protein
MTLTATEYRVIDFLADDAEPTWILLKEIPELGNDRPALERILGSLEVRGIVVRSREPSVNPAAEPMSLDDWWTLTRLGESALSRREPST